MNVATESVFEGIPKIAGGWTGLFETRCLIALDDRTRVRHCPFEARWTDSVRDRCASWSRLDDTMAPRADNHQSIGRHLSLRHIDGGATAMPRRRRRIPPQTVTDNFRLCQDGALAPRFLYVLAAPSVHDDGSCMVETSPRCLDIPVFFDSPGKSLWAARLWRNHQVFS
jgi:hypothetical protein